LLCILKVTPNSVLKYAISIYMFNHTKTVLTLFSWHSVYINRSIKKTHIMSHKLKIYLFTDFYKDVTLFGLEVKLMLAKCLIMQITCNGI